MSVTAKVYCSSKSLSASKGASTQTAQVSFAVDYSDGRNKEWAQATPWLELKMGVKDASLFELGKSYLLTFDEDLPDPDPAASEPAPTATSTAPSAPTS